MRDTNINRSLGSSPKVRQSMKRVYQRPTTSASRHSRRNNPQINRAMRPRRTSRAFVYFVVGVLVLALCYAGLSTLSRVQFSRFQKFVDEGNQELAAKIFDQQQKGFNPLHSQFNSRVRRLIISKYDEAIDAEKKIKPERAHLARYAEFQRPAANELASRLGYSVDSFDKDRTKVGEIDSALYYAQPFVVRNVALARIYKKGEMLLGSQRVFNKAQALERSAGQSSAALASYEKVSTQDSANYKLAQKKVAELKKRIQTELAEYKGPIRHIFTHCLLAWPQKAIASKSAKGYNIDCITVPEFKRMIQQLYDNDYMLININDAYELSENNTKVSRPKLMLPKGKKPLIMSIDDVTYDPRKAGNGMVDKLVVKNGKIYTYTEAKNSDTGRDEYSDDNEVFPILENFIAKNPDFSYKGARATLAMTGFIGCFGYRTDRLAKNQAEEIPKAQAVAQTLKKLGYTFASHSYSHHRSAQVSFAKVKDDSQKWKNETEPVVGKTRIYIWSYGESVPQSDPKAKLLRDTYGFRVFDGVGSGGFTRYDKVAMLQDRAPVDGYSLRHRETTYKKMFDCRTVFDAPVRSKLNPSAGGVQ